MESLESRWVLSANPVLMVVADQPVDEGTPFSITDLGTFTDLIEGGGSGGGAIGLDPTDYASLGAFDPAGNVTIDTTALTVSGFAGTGTTVMADIGSGSFSIAVFTFDSFELDAGQTISITGSRPAAILSKAGMLISGIINASAPSTGADQSAPGPGGGAGGDGVLPRDGDPAAGAPASSVGVVGTGTNPSGSGGGFGGAGGTGESDGAPAGDGGDAYGDLSIAIQGGSGGSASRINSSGGTTFTGGGGGGGIELGAVGTIEITVTGQVLANGGNGRSPAAATTPSTARGGGGGAGGGILVHGESVIQDGLLSAKGGNGGSRAGAGGGGGRITVAIESTGTYEADGSFNLLGGIAGTGGAEVAEDGEPGILEEPGSGPIFETYDFVIDWGDDSPLDTGAADIDAPGTTVGDTAQGSFDGSHTYMDDGLYEVIVTINDNNGGTDTKAFFITVNNVAPTLTISGATDVDEGSVYSLNLLSSDPGDDTITEWEINWGDGDIETVTGNPASVTHTYDDGDNNWTITATATDEDGTFAAGNTVDVAVNNVAPTLAISGAGSVDEGSVYTLDLSSFDPGDDTIAEWEINWGDGDIETVTGNPASISHTYEDGDNNWTISATATDEDGTFAAGNTVDVAVNNVVPTLAISGAGSVDEGSVYTLDLSSFDPGDDTIAEWEINWGDGDIETVTGNPASVTHTYDDGDNNWTITATATDEDGTFAAGNTVDVNVENVAPTLAIVGAALVAEGAVYSLSLSSSDPGNDTISSWTINWGDSVEVVTGNPSSVTHTYADGTVNYTISATATDEDGTYGAGNTVEVSVENVAPTLAISGAASVDEGSVYTLSLSSTDPGADAITSWTINWGDSVQVVSGNPTSVTHTYADGTVNYTISATATDEDGTFAAGNMVAVTVNNIAPTANAGGPYQTFDDTPITLNGTATDPAGTADPLTFTWDLDNDGVFGETGAGATRGNEVGANPTYNPVGLPTSTQNIKLRVSDGDGGVTTVTTTVAVLGQGTILIGDILYIVGSNTANDIAIITKINSSIVVLATFNNNNPMTFSAAAINEIRVRTRGGHDIVATTSNVNKLMTIDGGSGNDLLTGGSGRNVISGGTGNDVLYGDGGDDVLLGGDGNDDLFGGSGNDVLVGGNGCDLLDGGTGRDLLIGSQDEDDLYGGGDEDILIGGWTAHDNNVAALDAVMAIWSSSASFNARIASLTGSGGLLQGGVTVFDDDDDDRIVGGSGRDLIFGDTYRWDGAVDQISLQAAQDVLIAVN